MITPRHRQARIRRPVFLWALIALVAEIVTQQLSGRGLSHAWLVIVLLLPLLPALLFLAALAQAVRAMDELQQRICLESVFTAFMLTLTLSLVGDGLARAGLYHPAWDSLGTPMMALWAVSYIYTAWKYR